MPYSMMYKHEDKDARKLLSACMAGVKEICQSTGCGTMLEVVERMQQ